MHISPRLSGFEEQIFRHDVALRHVLGADVDEVLAGAEVLTDLEPFSRISFGRNQGDQMRL
jgi:hypothetical protein